jgi:hypothetical protein
MNRREFTTGLIAAGTATPALIRPAEAKSSTSPVDACAQLGRCFEDAFPVSRFARLVLHLGVGVVAVTWLVFLLPVLFALNFNRTIPSFTLAGAATALSVLSLTRAPFYGRFANATLLGSLVLFGSLLLVLPAVARLFTPGQVVLSHAGNAFAHPGPPRRVQIPNLPPMSDLANRPRVGEVYVNEKGETAVMATPLQIA